MLPGSQLGITHRLSAKIRRKCPPIGFVRQGVPPLQRIDIGATFWDHGLKYRQGLAIAYMGGGIHGPHSAGQECRRGSCCTAFLGTVIAVHVVIPHQLGIQLHTFIGFIFAAADNHLPGHVVECGE